MSKKRLEAWGEVLNGELAATHRDRKVVDVWAQNDAAIYERVEVVRLVELRPGEAVVSRETAAVVRAAVEWVSLGPAWTHLSDCRCLECNLHRAVERLQAKKRRAKP